MKNDYLASLNTVVNFLLKDDVIRQIVDDLKIKIRKSEEPFIWITLDVEPYRQYLPTDFKSVWIFVLKKDRSSIAHYHPNSIQHTIMIEGKGKVNVEERTEELKIFNSKDLSNTGSWIIIDKNIPHEFFPREIDMVVISFHTCEPDELVEIKCDSGDARAYEKSTYIHKNIING
jgi:hypothetical protein